MSVTFPATHPRKGDLTFFVEKIKKSLGLAYDNVIMDVLKLHTLRGNYPLWAKRFEKIMAGEAVLELYYWSGRPYASKTVTIYQLGKDDGIGIQKLQFVASSIEGVGIPIVENVKGTIKPEILAANDGLSLDDFKAWFKGCYLSKPMAIIHFTPFRY